MGRFDPGLPGPENRMRPVEEAFRTLGAGALARAAAAAGEWASVDEVGYLETSCPAYCQALLALMERKRVLLAVRKQELPFLQELCRRPDVFCVDLDAPFGRLGCVVMASGVGRRFGGGKLLAGLWGRPLLQYALDATGRRFPPPGGGHAGPRRRGPLPGAGDRNGPPQPALPQRHRPPGPRSPGRAGGAASGGVPVLPRRPAPAPPGDGGFPGSVRGLRAGPHLAARLAGQAGGAGPLPGVGPFTELAALPQGRGGGEVVRRHPERVRCVPVEDPAELLDIDRRQDLERLEQRNDARLL